MSEKNKTMMTYYFYIFFLVSLCGQIVDASNTSRRGLLQDAQIQELQGKSKQAFDEIKHIDRWVYVKTIFAFSACWVGLYEVEGFCNAPVGLEYAADACLNNYRCATACKLVSSVKPCYMECGKEITKRELQAHICGEYTKQQIEQFLADQDASWREDNKEYGDFLRKHSQQPIAVWMQRIHMK